MDIITHYIGSFFAKEKLDRSSASFPPLQKNWLLTTLDLSNLSELVGSNPSTSS
jgi:hypothetical protein